MILNRVNGYCSITSSLVIVNMQASCIELVSRRMQMVHVVQFKLVNTYWIVVWIRGGLRTVDEDFVTGLIIVWNGPTWGKFANPKIVKINTHYFAVFVPIMRKLAAIFLFFTYYIYKKIHFPGPSWDISIKKIRTIKK